MGLARVLTNFRTELVAFKSIGFQSVIDIHLNQKRLWRLTQNDFPNIGSEKSLSDTNGYLSLIKMATLNESYFEKFKSNKDYRKILEHVSRKFGEQYWRIIQKYTSSSQSLVRFILGDHCGPFRYSYSGIGRVSSTNLRYAKIALDVESLFGSSSDFNIVELGIGYGGQAIALHELNNFRRYTLVDLPEVKLLSLKYIARYYPLISNKISDSPEHWDLVISNYAFSELSREIQEGYFEKYIAKATRGYLIYNDIVENQFSTMSASEFLERVPGAELFNEVPLTYVGNKLIVWGHLQPNRLMQ